MDYRYFENSNVEEELCTDKVTLAVYTALAKRLLRYLGYGVRIVVDKEPVLFESAFSVLKILSGCSIPLTVKDKLSGQVFSVRLSVDQSLPPAGGYVDIMFELEPNEDTFVEELKSIAGNSRVVYVVFTRGGFSFQLSAAVEESNLVMNAVRDAIRAVAKTEPKYGELLRYLGRVPYEVLLWSPIEVVRNVAREWAPPPPSPGSALRKPVTGLGDLVLPGFLLGELRALLSVLRREQTGTLLLLGLHGSGKKTIAVALARELEMPAYIVSIANIMSKWVGESEKRLHGFFEALRAKRGLAVMENVDVLFKAGGAGNEGITSNLRNILFQELSRDDNNFVMVFTAAEDASQRLLDSPILGSVKLVVPPPDLALRERLVRRFLPAALGKELWRHVLALAEKAAPGRAEEYVYKLLGAPFAVATAGLTPREILVSLRFGLAPVVEEMVSRGKLVSAASVAEARAFRDYAARAAALRKLRILAVSLGQVEAAEWIRRLESEVEKKSMEVGRRLEHLRR